MREAAGEALEDESRAAFRAWRAVAVQNDIVFALERKSEFVVAVHF